VVRGDLLAEPVDAIVNAANGHLAHGGGVAAIIARAAGTALQEECERLIAGRGPLPTGSALVTTAGRLPFKGIIHAVGPRQGEGDEEKKLVKALMASWGRAHENGWESVSFPAVSSGIFAVRFRSAPAPTSRRPALRRCVRSGYACATNRSSTPSSRR